MHKIAARAAIIPVALMLVFLFVGKIDHFDSRVIREAWQTGHFFLFAGLAYILTQTHWLKKRPKWQVFAIIVSGSILIGLITEVLQFLVGRSFQLSDLAMDTIGGSAGFFLAQISPHRSLIQNTLACFVFVVLTIFGLNKFLVIVYDDTQIKLKTPILSDFETPFELTRWRELMTTHEVSKDVVRNGANALKVTFDAGKHPHSVLRDMHFDWRDYKALNLSIYNAQPHSQQMLLLIHDHESWRSIENHQDRFNKKLNLRPGWNDISVNIDDVRQGPKSRQIELNRIYSISFILNKIEDAKVLYIDHIYLSD